MCSSDLLSWPGISGNTVPEPDYGTTVRAALTLKTDGTRPILTREYPYPIVNGVELTYERDSSSHEEVIDGSTVRVPSIDLSVKSKGVSVSGTVTSYGSDSDDVTVQLIEEGHNEPAYETPVTGTSAAYFFETVPAGTYTLKVMKKGHAPFTKEIAVGDSNVTENVTIYLIGDVNGDGKIDANDMQRIYAHISGENPISISRGDVNGDGKVDANDMQRIYAHISGENLLS